MKTVRFVGSGLLGDFIHSLQAAFNICKHENAKADIYITDGYFGDVWKYGSEVAYKDLRIILEHQEWINSVNHLVGLMEGDFINLNEWRKVVATTHAETGKYDKCWTELLSETYRYPMPEYNQQWLKSKYINGDRRIVIHRSKHRHNNSFDWVPYLKCNSFFITTDRSEWKDFKHKDQCPAYSDNSSIIGLFTMLEGCELFVGNQSAPFAIACALNIPRVCELDADPAPFYMGEEKYSGNIKWYLNDTVNNL